VLTVGFNRSGALNTCFYDGEKTALEQKSAGTIFLDSANMFCLTMSVELSAS
jgi:hypothetical protein